MNVGMLWFDNNPKTKLEDKIERAAIYYREKYGNTPTVCFVHPSMINGEKAIPENGEASLEIPLQINRGLELRPNRSVLPNHFWIGVNGTSLGASDS